MKFLRLRLVIPFVVACCVVLPLASSVIGSSPFEGASAPELSELTVPTQLHGTAVPNKVAAYVGQQEPKKIELPVTKDTSADTVKKIETGKKKEADNAFDSLIKEVKAEKRVKISFKDIPLVQFLPLPTSLKSFLDGLVMYLPVVAVTKKGWSVDGMIDIGKVRVWGRIAQDTSADGKKRNSLSLELPKGWSFSQLFPKTEKFDPGVLDLLTLERAYIVLSDAKYKDPTLKKDIRPGLNFLAQVRPVGEFFETFDKLSGGMLKSIASVDVQGTIGLHEQLVGTVLELELPVGLRFTSWLSTSNLKIYIALEERLAQVVRPTVGISGGLHVLLPFQKNTVEFRMTGKYALPEDLELYGEMNGWLSNVPLPYMKVGDLRLGIVTDIAAAIGSGGGLVISGINVAGGIGVMDSKLHLAVKGVLDSATLLDDMTVIAKGTITLKDLAWFWVQYAEDITKIFKKDESFAQALIAKVPQLELNDAVITFVPKETIEEKKRIEVSVGSVNIFGAVASGMLYVDKQGIRGKLKLPEIVIGNKEKPLLYLTGKGEDGQRGMFFDVTLNPLEVSVMGDIEWGSSVLGLKSAGRAKVTSTGLEVSSDFKWAGVIDTQLTINAKLLSGGATLENFDASMKMKQSGQEKFAAILKTAATNLLTDLGKKLDIARDKGLSDVEGFMVSRDERLQAEIKRLEQQIKSKKDMCDQQNAGSKAILRPACYVLKGIVADSIALIAKKLQRKIELNASMVGGIVSIETVTETAKIVGRPLGKVMSFLADVLANAVVVRQFEAETSFKNLAENKPTTLKILDMRLAGKDFMINDLLFDVANPGEFLINLFDQLQLQMQKKQ